MTATLPMRTASPVVLTAAQWRDQIVGFARHRGWRTHFIHGHEVMATGFPTIVLVRSMPDGDRRIVFAALAPSHGHITSMQREWLHGLREVATMCGRHVEVHAWKPQDWPIVRKVLL